MGTRKSKRPGGGRRVGEKAHTAKRSGAAKGPSKKRPPSAAPPKRAWTPSSKVAAQKVKEAPITEQPGFASPQLALSAPEPDGEKRGSLPVVGIGASAGGLEALEQFLSNLPENSGMAFVVIQHLDPDHQGMLVELLQRVTKVPVEQATDGREIQPDHIYVIPPQKDMSLLHGVLHLLPQPSPRGLNLPIDVFFRSLADDKQEASIGVILSGMGSDGTRGLRAIKEKAGASFVQSLSSAKFDGMPRSAIEAGLADVIAPAEELPAKIIAYQRHAPYIAGRETMSIEEKVPGALEKVFILLRAQTGNDFSLYKKSTILRRIERRMGLHQIDNLQHYVRFLRENPREVDLLFKELLIGVTSFFRDPPAWEPLLADVMPALLATRSACGVVRAWVPGCSTGEEAYSLAMVFKEALEPFKPAKNISLQIFATDLDRDAIERAREGLYPESIVADVSPERLRRFFVQDDRGYRVSKEIRESVVFAPQNVVSDPPFTKLDILSCRNLLIYLSSDLQKKLIPLFHYSLNPGGVLFLGSAETIGSFSGLFSNVDAKSRLYRRHEQSTATVQVEFPTSTFSGLATPVSPEPSAPVVSKAASMNLQAVADRVLVQRFSPVAVLCNDRGDILYVSGRAGKYLEPPVGKANLNIFAMAREGLRFELSRVFSAALREERMVVARNLNVGTNGGTQTVDLKVQKLLEPEELRGTVMVVFADVAKEVSSPAGKPRTRRSPESIRHAELVQELARAREEVQTTREEMQTSQEELKSTNEELQSTNEELQSTNEELTTSKEEMQSLNEELQTVNHELQAKVDELSRSNNDMKNLLNSTDIATLFLDGGLNVRRFTTPTAKIIKLIAGDVGRPITDIASEIHYPDLADDAREVLRTLVFKEKQVVARDGRWFAVRIMPYRTLENVIDGVVITFTDVSANRSLEHALRMQADQLRQMTESLPNLVWTCRPDGMCDYLSRQWVEYTGISDVEQLGYGWLEQIHPEDRERFRDEWRAAIKNGVGFDSEVRIRGANGQYHWFKSRSAPVRNAHDMILKWYGTGTDIDDLKRAEGNQQRSLEGLRAVLDGIHEAFLALDGDLAVTFVNHAAEQMLGRGEADLVGRPLLDAAAELRGSLVEERLREVLQAQTPLSLERHLDGVQAKGLYRVRVYPQREPPGLSLFFERTSKPELTIVENSGEQ